MSEIENGFGENSYEGQRQNSYRKPFSLKPGENIYRILPSMKSLQPTRKWHIYLSVHWGYEVPGFKDPTKSFGLPFACIEDRDRNTKMVLRPCPECDLIAARKEEYETRLASIKAASANAAAAIAMADADPEVTRLKIWLKNHRVDRKQWLAAQNVNGEFAPLRISHKLFKQFEQEIKNVKAKYGINDPLGYETGVWWNFQRLSQNAFENTDTVRPVYDFIDGADRLRVTSLAPFKDKALAECRDLAEMGGRNLTSEQIRALTLSDGSPAAVSAIIGPAPKQQAYQAPAAASPPPAPPAASLPPMAQAPAAQASYTTALVPPAAAPAVPPPAALAPSMAAETPSALAGVSDADFFARFKLNG